MVAMSAAHVHFLGHSTLRLELGGVRVLTDPILRPVLGPLVRHGPVPDPATYADLDLIVVSHLHLDHFDVPSLRLIPRGPVLVIPKGATGLLAGTHHHDLVEMLPGDTIEIRGLTLRATAAEHPGNRRPGGLDGIAMGFMLEAEGERVYFAGDTDLFPGMSDLGSPDLAFVPVSGWGLTRGRGHLDPRDAAEALTLIRPRAAIPIHWGTLWPRGMAAVRSERRTGAGPTFERFAAELAPEVHVAVPQPGHRVSLAHVLTGPRVTGDPRQAPAGAAGRSR
jgi:L-ascorbate metabolism protein UlaG (beta-lactamase superfamily)